MILKRILFFILPALENSPFKCLRGFGAPPGGIANIGLANTAKANRALDICGILKCKAYILFCCLLNSCVALVPLIEKKQEDLSKQDSVLAEQPVKLSKISTRKILVRKKKPADIIRQKTLRAVKRLKNPSDVVRTHAASDLGDIGPKASIAIESLSRAVKHDKSKWVRRAAVKALGKIGGTKVIAILRLALRDRNKWVAHSAANILRRMGQRHTLAYKPEPRSRLRFRARGNLISEF